MTTHHLAPSTDGHLIQAAIDQASAAGGGVVCLQPGIHMTGTIYLKSNVELHLCSGAKLQGFDRPELYDDFTDPGFDAVSPEKSRKCLLAAKHAENIAVTGLGEINGAGPAFYDTNVAPGAFFAKPPHPRPRMVQFYNCKNVRVDGVSFVDSPSWTFWLLGCEDVYITRIRLHGCQQMINNDGIDIDDCRRVTVSDCHITTGDDCIILRAIRRGPEHHALCEDVTVTNCVLNSSCQGIRIGCPSDDTIRNATFSNIVIHGAGNGININNPVRYLRAGDTGFLHLSNLVFTNFTIDAGRVPLWINVEKSVKLRHLGSMTFSNFRIRAPQPIRLDGSPETPIEDITLSDVSITTTASVPLVAEHVRRLSLNHVECTAMPAAEA